MTAWNFEPKNISNKYIIIRKHHKLSDYEWTWHDIPSATGHSLLSANPSSSLPSEPVDEYDDTNYT